MRKSDSDPHFSTPEAVEVAFYAAFEDCDVKAMEAVWAGNDDVICIHPGSVALQGRDAVMRSWATILLDTESPDLHIEVLSCTERDGLAVHVVEEHILPEDGSPATEWVVLATNVYRRDADSWRLYEHHASVPRSLQSDSNTGKQGQYTLQ